MCNSHRQRRLVKDRANTNTASPITSPKSENAVCQHCTKKYNFLAPAATTGALTVQMVEMMARSRSRTTRTFTTTASGIHSASCVNQIIEVLLAILLVNFLANTLVVCLPAAAAFSGTRNREFNRPSSGSRNSFSRSNSGDGAYANYRQAHSNGEARRTTLGYNSLPHQQHHFVDNEHFQAALSNHLQQRSQNFKISPKPCSIGRIEGTCMFVWECIKSEGQHVGMCVDSFMFGSCCAHNYTANIVLPQTFSYTRPTKPVGISSLNHRPRPPHSPHRPVISGMTTIERPHGAGTLVIRPSGPHHQGALVKPQYHIKPSTSSSILELDSTTSRTTSTEDPILFWTSNPMFNDLQSAASVPSSFATTDNMWYSSSSSSSSLPSHDTTAVSLPVQQHWHLTTEPNFITKPRPPSWEKPMPLHPKPSKPTKRPPPFSSLPQHSGQQQEQTLPSSAVIYSTHKPLPVSMKPTKPVELQHRPKPTKTAVTTTSISESSLQSTSSTSISIATSTTTVPDKHRPTPIFFQSVTSAVTKPINRPTLSTYSTTTATTHHPNVDASTASLPGSQIPSYSHNLTSIESNEIGDTSSETGVTIKTISAARSDCGIPVLARPETRIVGGKSAAFGRWPWQVSVRRTSFFGFSSTHRCGGALINEKWIATAGHCVDDLLISQIRIRVGEYDFSHVQEQLPYIERGVAKKVVHPKYNFFTYEYDLALVKLEQPLEFAPHVSPICLPQTNSLLIGMNATVTGWGRLSEGGTLPSVLQEVSVPIVSNDNCKTMFLRAGRQEFIPEIFLCAGYETGGQDSCQGDSGGPLQVKSEDGRFFLAGIISWGIGCAEANLPGVCTRISKFVPWIMESVT